MIRSVTEEPDVPTLRTRVEALEAENAELRRRSAEAVARETRQARKLDELGLDLNALMKKPGAKEFRALLRGVRAAVRLFRFEIPKRLRDSRRGRRLKNR